MNHYHASKEGIRQFCREIYRLSVTTKHWVIKEGEVMLDKFFKRLVVKSVEAECEIIDRIVFRN